MLSVNQQISKKFYHQAQKLQGRGERYKFRAMSYWKAAQAIDNLDTGVDEIYNRGWLAGLQKINGIGNRLAHDIENELKKLGAINKKLSNKANK